MVQRCYILDMMLVFFILDICTVDRNVFVRLDNRRDIIDVSLISLAEW